MYHQTTRPWTAPAFPGYAATERVAVLSSNTKFVAKGAGCGTYRASTHMMRSSLIAYDR